MMKALLASLLGLALLISQSHAAQCPTFMGEGWGNSVQFSGRPGSKNFGPAGLSGSICGVGLALVEVEFSISYTLLVAPLSQVSLTPYWNFTNGEDLVVYDFTDAWTDWDIENDKNESVWANNSITIKVGLDQCKFSGILDGNIQTVTNLNVTVNSTSVTNSSEVAVGNITVGSAWTQFPPFVTTGNYSGMPWPEASDNLRWVWNLNVTNCSASNCTVKAVISTKCPTCFSQIASLMPIASTPDLCGNLTASTTDLNGTVSGNEIVWEFVVAKSVNDSSLNGYYLALYQIKRTSDSNTKVSISWNLPPHSHHKLPLKLWQIIALCAVGAVILVLLIGVTVFACRSRANREGYSPISN